MNTYYAVCSIFYDNGTMTANLVDSIEAENKPENTSKIARDYNIYVDWFETQEEAMKFIKDSYEA